MTTRPAELAPGAARVGWPWLEVVIQVAWRSCHNWQAGQPSGPGAESTAAPCDVGWMAAPTQHTSWTGPPQDASWTALPRVATRTPAPQTQSIPAARAFTLRTMHRWGAADRAEDAAAVVSEFLTNALQHALPQAMRAAESPSPWPIRLGLLHPGPYVICAVSDPSNETPVARQPDWQDECGRGLLVVASLSDRWGCASAPSGAGKVVWAALATAARPR